MGIDIFKKKMNIGKAKAILDRQRNYLSFANFLMLLFLFMQKIEIKWYYLFIIPLWFVWIFIDVKLIWPKEINFIHRQSPMLKEILKSVRENEQDKK